MSNFARVFHFISSHPVLDHQFLVGGTAFGCKCCRVHILCEASSILSTRTSHTHTLISIHLCSFSVLASVVFGELLSCQFVASTKIWILNPESLFFPNPKLLFIFSSTSQSSHTHTHTTKNGHSCHPVFQLDQFLSKLNKRRTQILVANYLSQSKLVYFSILTCTSQGSPLKMSWSSLNVCFLLLILLLLLLHLLRGFWFFSKQIFVKSCTDQP